MTSFPLPLVWSAPFAWQCALWDAPVVLEDEVIVRAGARLVALAPGDGAVRWNVVVPGANLGGQVLLATRDIAVCDFTQDRMQHLVGATSGGVRWKGNLGGDVVRGGALLIDGAIHALVTARDGSVHRSQIDPATGKQRKLPLPAGGERMVRAGGELIVLSQGAARDAPGAYALGSDGTPARVLRNGDVWYAVVSGGSLLTVGTRKRDDFVVELCDLASGELRWGEPCRSDTAALDGDEVVHAAASRDGVELVARSAATGEERWRTPLGDVELATLSIAGSVILARYMTGMIVLDRSGRVLGDAPGVDGFFGTVAGDRLYLGGNQALLAARLA